MSMTPWNPFREMEDLLNQMQRNFGGSVAKNASPASTAPWAPVVDISETPREYVVKAELPGLGKDQVKVTVDNGMLTLSGERKFEKEDKDEKHHRVERSYGSFARSFTLPEDVMADGIRAECNDGVVRVHLPKAEVKKPRAIEVKVQ